VRSQEAGDVVGALIDHTAVKRINFTGYTAVGRIMAKRAAVFTINPATTPFEV